MGIRLDKAELLAIFLETLSYGIFLTLFVVTTFVLWTSSARGSAQHRVLIPAGAFMLVVATGHVVIGFIRIVHGFIQLPHVPDGAAIRYFEDIAHPLFVTKYSLLMVQTLIGDALLIWRFYVVYGRQKRILVPMLGLLTATMGAGFTGNYFVSQADQDATIFATSSAILMAGMVLTMVNCIICTAAINWKIYTTGQSVRQSPTTVMIWPTMVAVADSGGLYTAGMIAEMITYLTGSNAQYCTLDIITPLIGISFCLIVLQVRYHVRSQSFHTPASSDKGLGMSSTASRAVNGDTRKFTSGLDGIPMHPVEVHVTRATEYDGEPPDSPPASARSTTRFNIEM